MGHLKAILLFVILCCLTQERSTSETGQFLGASVSFAIINGTKGSEVRIDVISGWVLGLGPCGINCSRASVNSDTKYTREEVLQRQGDSHFFGNLTVETRINGSGQSHNMLINQEVYSHLTERVIDVSEKARWEQDWMVVHYPVPPGATIMHIMFEGHSWTNLSVQGENAAWHLQMRGMSALRSDTGKPNNSPQAFSKPFYRLLLDQQNFIRIATIDPDGDHVTCSMAAYVEGGVASRDPLPNVTVTKDCIIMVPASRTLGYHHGSVGAVAITVRDYNLTSMSYGRSLSDISSIGVQFLVQFLDNISEPRFISPTPEGNQRFNLYSGTTWKIDVYAEPISPALIDHFSCLGRQLEGVRIINVKNISVPTHANVMMATIMWTPLDTDVGDHIVCVGVEDSVGMDSSDQRCYILEVKPSLEVNQSVNVQSNKPYFINIPQKDVLWCDENVTCIFPMYAKTPTIGAHITSIWLGTYYVYWAKNDTENINSGNGVYKADISIRHVTGGPTTVCVYAQDSTGAISDETCISPRVIPPDPCAKVPCQLGFCRRTPEDLSQFTCECPTNHFYGRFCENEVSDCPPGLCLHGACRDMAGPNFRCICTPGWTGRLCDTNINDCVHERCNNHGICNDEVNGYSCDCFYRYQGENCSIDRCNTSLLEKSCAEPGCHAHSCNNNGVCTTGGTCHCSLGYEGSANCDTGKTFHPSQQVSFVEPTFAEGSIITCYNRDRCQFSVFIAGGSNPEVGIQYISDDLNAFLNASTPVHVHYVPGIQSMFESVIKIETPLKKYLGHQYVCLEAHERGGHGNGLSSRCFNIVYIEDQRLVRWSQEYADINKTVKFVDPTPKGQSQFYCKVNESCHLFVFTNKDNDSNCHEVVTTTKVYVQPVKGTQSDCFTDVSFNFPEKGTRTLCLKAADTDGEKRCFTIDIIVPSEAHNATTAPLVLQRSDIECQTTSLKIFVPKDLVSGNGIVTWRDSACVVHSNGTHFVDSVGLRDCGTTLTFEADSVVFENDLILHKNGTQMQNGNNIVTYGSDYEFAIPVKCVYPRNSNISTSYIPIVQQVKILERRNGHLDLTMRQYEAEDYSHPVPFNAYPRQVPLNNDIFIRVAMENNVTGLGLSADNCFATSTPSPIDPNWYQLISSGCPINNAKIHPSGINDVKFSFHAFNFRHNTSGIVYVHCQVSVCLETDPACVVGCVTRKKRSASAREGAITSNLISTGPFIMTTDEGGVAMSTVVAAVSIAVAVIATVVAIIGWTRKSKKGADF